MTKQVRAWLLDQLGRKNIRKQEFVCLVQRAGYEGDAALVLIGDETPFDSFFVIAEKILDLPHEQTMVLVEAACEDARARVTLRNQSQSA